MKHDINIGSKAEVLVEALPYLQRFRGSVFVVKFGGAFMDTEQARIGVAKDLVFLATVGIRVVVVHGGGPAINKAMEEARIEPVWRNGLRYTGPETITIVERVMNTVINPGLCERIADQGGSPFGIAGQELFWCQPATTEINGEEVDLGYVGDITFVEKEKLLASLEREVIPVVSPVGRDAGGQFFNINADLAASRLAAAIGARRLVYLCDVPGLLRDPKDPESLLSSLCASDVPSLKEAGVIGSGMLPKVESAVEAIGAGVHRVHLIDGRLPHSMLLEIFTDKGVGTEIVQSTVLE
ncbi:MAG: hypothetical protein RL648_1533 [Verrucomicrobiota bacterium]|jgi:acetylglutamate kinase